MRLHRFLAGCVLLCGAVPLLAQEYPSRGILLVVPFTPGTTTDSLARLIQPQLSQRWGVPVVVENRAGASGAIGIESVARAAPDGHTLLFAGTAFGTLAAVQPKLPYDPARSFAPVMLVGTSPLALVVSNYFPAKSVKELIAQAKRRPGDLNYATSGAGSVFHLTMELLQHETGTKMVHVPYKGSTGVMNDLVAGHVSASLMVFQTAAPLVQAGRLRMLAVLSPQRSQVLPGVPTIAEAGFPGMLVEAWAGFMAPARTPPAAIVKFNGEVNNFLATPEMRSAANRIGVTLIGGAPEVLDSLVRKEISRWTQVAARAKIKLE
jgi:tripartite-type tricarboxylate transporter receptor subunit TctC